MRVLHVISSAAAGGAEIYVRDLSSEMIKIGHQVFILFLDRASETGGDCEFEADFLKQLDDNKVGYDFIGTKARKRPWLGIKKVNKVVSNFLPDVVHCHLYYAVIFSLFVKTANIIYTHHNIKLGVHPLFYKLLDLKVVRYIGICFSCKTMLEKVSRKKVVRIDNGVDVSRLLPKDLTLPPGDPLILVSVGRLSVQKNLSLLIDALHLLPSQHFILKIAGDGPLKNKLMKQVVSLEMEKKIVFLGNVKDVNRLLNSADIFVMSSSWEGLPIAQIEATLTGLPVVVTSVGGCAEIVHRVANGLVVNELLPDELARQITKLMNNSSLRSIFSENALLYSDDYRINVATEKHIAMYKNILEDAGNTYNLQ